MQYNYVINGEHIATSFVFPPIPDRTHDWAAWYDDQNEDSPVGYGRTEQEAINDLIQNYEAPNAGWLTYA
jgi:hypothetical protein